MGSGGQWWVVVGSGGQWQCTPFPIWSEGSMYMYKERDGLADQTNYPTVLCSWSCDVGVLWTE